MSEEYTVSTDRTNEWNTLVTNGVIKIFREFLKNNNFYVQWNEAYDLDNKCFCSESMPLKEFFNKCDGSEWLGTGVGISQIGLDISSSLKSRNSNILKLENSVNTWRKNNLSSCIRLNTEWKKKFSLLAPPVPDTQGPPAST